MGGTAQPAADGTERLVCALAMADAPGAATRVLQQARGPGDATVVLVVGEHDTGRPATTPETDVHHVRPEQVTARVATLAGSERQEVVVVTTDLVAHDLAVRMVLDAPGEGARLLTGPAHAGPAGTGSLLLEDGFVVGVDPVAVPGAPQPLGVLRAPAQALAAAAEAPVPEGLDPFLALVAGLVQAGTDVRTVDRRGFVAERVADEASRHAVLARTEDVDQDRAAMDAAVKSHDGFFTTFFVSPYSRHLARWLARRGATPNQVTVLSMVMGVAAGASFALGTLPARVAGALLLQLAFTFDCVDGQVARYARRFSPFGAWLDGMFDRGKEYLVYVGLALGALRTGEGEDIWLLLALTVVLQTLRHHLDLAWNAQADAAAAAERRRGLRPRTSTAGGEGSALIGVAHGLNRYATLKWAKQVVTLPIGERFLLISVVSVVAGPRATFQALLLWGLVAAAYTATGRLLRSRG